MKIVWFSEIKWDYLKTRKQQIIERFPEDWEVLFIEPYVLGKKNHFWPKRKGRVTHATVPFFKATPHRFVNFIQNNLIGRTLISINGFVWVWMLTTILGFDGKDRVIATSNIYFFSIIKRLKRRRLIYDCNDYPLGFTLVLDQAEKKFQKTVAAADVVTTVSKKLMEDLLPYHPKRVEIIGNGVDTMLFEHSVSRPPDFPKTEGKVLFFSGAIADWLNVELLEKLAVRYPMHSVVLLGPIKDATTGRKLHELSLRYRLFLISEKPHNELPNYIGQADVCMLPFRMNRRILGANPNTLYEFLAGGKPVVTFGFSDEVKSLAPIVQVAENEDDFIRRIGIATTTSSDPQALKAVAKKNDWSQKSYAMADLFKI